MKRDTTKRDFKQFQESFLYWQKEFGLTQWQVFFRCEDIGSNYGRIDTNIAGRVVAITITDCCEGKKEIEEFDPTFIGRHEAIHLLLSELTYHGHARYIHESDISDAGEAIVRRLEKVLGDK